MKTNITYVGSWTLALADEPEEPREREHKLVLKGFSASSSDSYTLEDWVKARCKHEGRGFPMRDGTIYPTQSWKDMTSQAQTRAVRELVYKREVKRALGPTENYWK